MANAGSPAYLNAPSTSQKASELHRACSIPAIIVGEIPKLIVTSSTETSTNTKSSNIQRSFLAPFMPNKYHFSFRTNITFDKNKSAVLNMPEKSSKINNLHSNDKANKSENVNEKTHLKFDNDPVCQYYISILREEFKRLRIVELKEKLGDMTQRLDKYLWYLLLYKYMAK